MTIDPKPFLATYEDTKEKAKTKLSEYKQCRGYILSNQFDLIGRAYKIHLGNYHDLNSLFTKYYTLSFAVKFWRQDGEKDREEFIHELIRALHNFLASTSTLVDHTRVVNRLIYNRHDFLQEYEERVKRELASSDLVQFVKRLRNYFTHVGVAPLRLSHEIKNGEFIVDLTLLKDELLKHDGWNAKSREFIETFEKEASLRPLIDSYCNRIQEFYLWYQNRFAEIFRLDFEEANRLQNEYNELLSLADRHHNLGINDYQRAVIKERESQVK